MAGEATDDVFSEYVEDLKKAIICTEEPIKMKDMWGLIIGTFQVRNTKIFWDSACGIPITNDRIVAWKFCYVLHRILREGHPLSILDSQSHREDLRGIGILSLHFPNGYGKIIALYTSLLSYKLEFHEINPKFPGHLGLSPEELVSIGGENVKNNYVNLTIAMFDYIDHILALQEAVFDSLNTADSMTSAVQCRLFPLVLCIQDASKLYDHCIIMLLQLHIILAHNVLMGHRARFNQQFRVLKRFYGRVSNLQYFKDLVVVPSLPDDPPFSRLLDKSPLYVSEEELVAQKPDERKTEVVQVTNLSIGDDGRVKHVNNHWAPARSVHKGANDGMVHLSVSEWENIIQEREFLRTECERLKGEITSLVSRSIQETSLLQ